MCGRRDAADLGLRGNDTLAAVVPHPGDVLLLSESGSAGVRSFSPLRSLLPDVAEKAEHQEVTVTGVACSRRTRAPRLPHGSTLTAAARRTCVAPRAPGTPRLQSLGCHRAAESKPCLRASGV